ncbi:MAG: AarF/ABC1/UbiB kinase family protein [Deltaproteobacteria bacterium]|nr:MAG: AarF/ABC1/UbiB kinase family protein [Deltaproteobacteria bacterium]
MRFVRPVVETMADLRARLRDLSRLQEVATVLIRHGLGMLVAGIDIPGLNTEALVSRSFQSTPERLVAAIEELGPTFVKLGQVMSTRPDILPPEYIAALEQLQDHVAPVPFSEVQATLDDELGPAWRDRVAILHETPLATASVAQVHRGTLPDGRDIVFKVQRRGIARQILADIHILEFLARRALHEYPEARAFDPIGVLEEFERSIFSELDFEEEADNARRIARNFADKPHLVHIPEIVGELSTRRVLCMEYLEGTRIRDARAAGFDMVAVGRKYLEVSYDMLFEHGFFHGDLHPGNVLVLPDGRLGLLDFGMVGRLTQEMRENVIQVIFALQRGDYRTVARIFYDVAIKEERVDYRAVERDTVALMDKYWAGSSIRELRMGPYVVELASRAARRGARIPSAYTMFFKAIVTSEGLAKSLIEEVDPIQAAEPYIRRFLRQQLSEERLRQELLYTALTMGSLARRLPGSVSQFLDDVEAQRVRIQVQDPDLQRALAAADRRTNRAVLAALGIGAFACGTLALFASPFHPWGVPVISLVFYLVGGLLAGLSFLMVLRNRGVARDPSGRT